MKYCFLTLIALILGACANAPKKNEGFGFTGKYLCSKLKMKKPGEKEFKENFGEFEQSVEVKNVNGLDVLVAAYPKMKDYPASKMVWIIDNKWNFSRLKFSKNEKVMKYKASLNSKGVINWESKIPAYTNQNGESIPASVNSGKWWIDPETGNKKSQANYVKGVVDCKRL